MALTYTSILGVNMGFLTARKTKADVKREIERVQDEISQFQGAIETAQEAKVALEVDEGSASARKLVAYGNHWWTEEQAKEQIRLRREIVRILINSLDFLDSRDALKRGISNTHIALMGKNIDIDTWRVLKAQERAYRWLLDLPVRGT